MTEHIKGDVFSSEGRDKEFGDKTDIACSTCNPSELDDPNKYLYKMPGADGTVEYECKNCGHSEFMPDNHDATGKTDIRGRPLIPPKF